MSGSSKYILEGGEQDLDARPRFIVLGVGGGGGNAVEHMVQQGVDGITFVCVNTDKQALDTLSVQHKVQLGPGLGAGGKPEKGRDFAEENIEEIRSLLTGFDMVFITAGMGGGTGTGAAPVVARIAKEMGILTVAVVTTPFIFEGSKRIKNAKEGVLQLSENVDSIITVSNQKLLEMHGGMDLNDARKKVDDILLHAVTGLAQIVKDGNKSTSTAIINVDFSDVQSAMSARGHALMGIGRASGEDRARAATVKAINSPLLDGLKLENAKGLLVNIRSSKSALEELGNVAEVVGSIIDSQEAEMFYGVVQDESMGDEIQVTVVATGLVVDDRPAPVARPKPLSSAYAIDPAAHTTAISQKRTQEVQEAPQPAPTPAPQRQGGINVATYLQEHMPKK